MYRRELVGMWHFWRSGTSEPAPVTGKASAAGLASATNLVDSLQLRGIPFPSSLTGRFMSASLDASEDGTVKFALPPGIRDLKVRPSGVVLYGGGR